MTRFLRAFLTLVLAFCSPGSAGALSIINSKHDLSADSTTTGPKAVTEQDTCKFCHIPHQAQTAAPLWNKSQTTQNFTFYSSNYLNTYLGMTAPTMASLPGTRTKLCLSCHDGVTALGSVYNIGGGLAGTIQVSGTLGSASNIGLDLSNDHPVLYDVKPGAGPPTLPGTDPEIQLPGVSDAVKVYGATSRVECTSCHNPHDNQYGKFLVKANTNAALCTTCHVKSGFSVSAHATSVKAYTPPGGTATTVGEYSCRDCHSMHGATAAQPYLLRGAEQAACYLCHGNPPLAGTKNLQSLFAKTYKHPTETLSGIHKDPETDGTNFTFSPTNKRHSECQDCHNPHQAKTGTHASPGNLIGSVLLGGWGVEPTYGTTSWVAATSYTRQVFANTTSYKEYQLCLKCHSSYAFSTTPPTGYTDVSTEININNRGAHPVRVGLSSQTGATTPKPLVAGQMSAPFTTVGTQTMACTDCHGEDTTGEPKGPHGSGSRRMLKGTRKYWPASSAGTLFSLRDVSSNLNNWSTQLFCVNCHPLYSGSSWKNNVHSEHASRSIGSPSEYIYCIDCHVVVPHGSKRSRLIGYASETAPYNYNGGTYKKLIVTGFKKATTPTGYSKSNCYSTVSGCTTHGTMTGADP